MTSSPPPRAVCVSLFATLWGRRAAGVQQLRPQLLALLPLGCLSEPAKVFPCQGRKKWGRVG